MIFGRKNHVDEYGIGTVVEIVNVDDESREEVATVGKEKVEVVLVVVRGPVKAEANGTY